SRRARRTGPMARRRTPPGRARTRMRSRRGTPNRKCPGRGWAPATHRSTGHQNRPEGPRRPGDRRSRARACSSRAAPSRRGTTRCTPSRRSGSRRRRSTGPGTGRRRDGTHHPGGSSSNPRRGGRPRGRARVCFSEASRGGEHVSYRAGWPAGGALAYSRSVPVLTANDLVRSYGARAVLDGVSLTLEEGERVGLVGSNGSGKSTLGRILAGVEEADRGSVVTRRGLRVGYLPQEPRFEGDPTAREAVL